MQANRTGSVNGFEEFGMELGIGNGVLLVLSLIVIGVIALAQVPDVQTQGPDQQAASDSASASAALATSADDPAAVPFVITDIEVAEPEAKAAAESVDSRAVLKDLPEASSGNALLPSPASQQPRDGAARDFKTEDELRLQLGLKSMELAESRMECEELQRRVEDLNDSVKKLTERRIAELDQLSTVGGAWPMLTVIGADWCGHCQAWKKSPGDLPKRFIDEHDSRPADITESEWAGIQADRAKVAALPFVFWRAKSGQIKWLVGRYSDKQLGWSIKEADRLDELQYLPVQPIEPAKPQPVTRPSGSIASAPQSTGATR